MKSKEELAKIGAHYFQKPEIKSMYATQDGQWFHGNAEGLVYAQGHASTAKCQIFEITRADVEGKPVDEAKSLNKMNKDELEKELASLEGISEDDVEGVMKLTKSKIVNYIESYELPVAEEEEAEETESSGE